MCDHIHSLVDFALSAGRGKTWAETMAEVFTFQCLGCWKMECLRTETASLSDIVKGMEMRMTKEIDGIVQYRAMTWRDRKEQYIAKKDDGVRLREGRLLQGKQMENEQQKT